MDPAPPQPRAVAAAFRLSGRVGELVPVDGAWSNRVYRLVVGDHAYAVKEMRNPWDIPQWRAWLEEAWAFERLAIDRGVAAPEPVATPDGGCLAEVDRTGGGSCPVRVHRWVTAEPAHRAPASRDLAEWAGATLATLHSLSVVPANRSIFPTLSTHSAGRWPGLVEQALAAGVDWAGAAATATRAVDFAEALANEAGDGRDEEVMTHGDIDQKNILLAGRQPLLCDWDVASPLVPRREVADVALSFAGWQQFDIARAVVEAYRAAGGELDRIIPADLGQPLMIGLDWIVLNIERALRLRPCTDAEAELGQTLVPGLLADLERSVTVAGSIESLLAPS